MVEEGDGASRSNRSNSVEETRLLLEVTEEALDEIDEEVEEEEEEQQAFPTAQGNQLRVRYAISAF
jgi:hypothetical protein